MSIKLLNEKRMDELIQFIHQEEITKDKNRVKVKVNMFGRDTIMDLEFNQIQKI